ncbi:MAG: hypothetical protein P4M05_33555 [Bradyrhizobium sp.]|nr:hypothetical protein [Bradyrhizobium sp.]
MLTTIVGLGLSSAHAQDAGPVRISPIMQQAGQAMQQGNFSAAANYMRAAAAHGDPMGQVGLGKLYLEGRGVQQNTAEGFRLMRLVLKKHQEPSYTLAVNALHGIAQSNGTGPAHRDAAGEVLSAVENLRNIAHQRLEQMSPAERELIRRASRPVYNGVVVCNGTQCY